VRAAGARAAGGANRLLVKGAPDSVLARCTKLMLPGGEVVPLSGAARAAIADSFGSMGKSALRCIALASKPARALGALASHDGGEDSRTAKLLTNPDRCAHCVWWGATVLGGTRASERASARAASGREPGARARRLSI
jgi:magnesium-transporting ATPase (P-type)